MRFIEVTGRLSVPVQYRGHPHDGMPLNVAIPRIGNIRIWQAVHGGYSWAIMHEPGLPSWSDKEKAEHIGYTASYRKIGHNNSSQTILVDGGPWNTFTKAQEACQLVWKQIRNLQ